MKKTYEITTSISAKTIETAREALSYLKAPINMAYAEDAQPYNLDKETWEEIRLNESLYATMAWYRLKNFIDLIEKDIIKE